MNLLIYLKKAELTLFIRGSFYQRYYNALRKEESLNKIRDKEIGRVLEKSEEALRYEYPHLARKDPLILAVNMGALHYPEKYTSLSLEVISLLGSPKCAGDKLDQLLLKTRDFEALKPFMLACGAAELANQGRIPFNATQIEKMDYSSLVRSFER